MEDIVFDHEQKPGHGADDAQRAAEQADEQGLLFTDDVSPLPSDTGYRGPTACNAAGISYRQLDYLRASIAMRSARPVSTEPIR